MSRVLDVHGSVRPLGAVPLEAPAEGRGQKLVSIVLPLHNEAGNLAELHARLCKVLDATPYRSELIFVDDGSKDDSAALIEQLASRDRRVKLVKLSRNFGHQNAL
ncbi:MAG TPA: glycosyltransferase, partial [Vicinamibacterales bacterium]|nr:glycosyltransferase [Vicinamibacterales bacterium]